MRFGWSRYFWWVQNGQLHNIMVVYHYIPLCSYSIMFASQNYYGDGTWKSWLFKPPGTLVFVQYRVEVNNTETSRPRITLCEFSCHDIIMQTRSSSSIISWLLSSCHKLLICILVRRNLVVQWISTIQNAFESSWRQVLRLHPFECPSPLRRHVSVLPFIWHNSTHPYLTNWALDINDSKCAIVQRHGH